MDLFITHLTYMQSTGQFYLKTKKNANLCLSRKVILIKAKTLILYNNEFN
jgi:hypothetical protein